MHQQILNLSLWPYISTVVNCVELFVVWFLPVSVYPDCLSPLVVGNHMTSVLISIQRTGSWRESKFSNKALDSDSERACIDYTL